MAPRTVHNDSDQSDSDSDSDSDFDTDWPFYKAHSIRKFARKRFPYAVQLLPGPDDIKYHVQSVKPGTSNYMIGITIGHIGAAGRREPVSAVMALTGEVNFYLTEEKKRLSRRERSDIELITPWAYLERGEKHSRLREVCALSAWYLMIHNCGVIEPVAHFTPCDTHKLIDLHIAVLMVGNGIRKAEGIQEKDLSIEDVRRLCIDEIYAPDELDTGAEEGLEEEATSIVEDGNEITTGGTEGSKIMTQAELFKGLLALTDPAKRGESASLTAHWEENYGSLN
ncbi:hypothetical protein HBI56_059570 [Parastagonospora nodorum]|uniref:Uncharacterized protein n=2 Tax=Phaeosphaeria nodorum (strain SN15 / ATCC MYA-4574 / FGSC 10173) TaxID=321614 RepID=A0A7U2I2E7_PHANO|nr:hypothetical protein SNOG_08880 [Parastagonospora nodorum SN15]KAH3947065.1 hypothetical protein HBH53_122860 [Parastagonospora nodorum]EAT84048.2 hypothetical protein SNOG_08880 [Parastagonospora nodorum SN15]KAH4002459.1 hypothetical protein HBI10_072420 [Parastagonospora nodorum]KAH4018064.1 hypothetical protein HBI13_138710 [Parastagonospora nodorum]KAH4036303.1 hypothetical protein HBI09_085290 [Parastagonospora nodorum]